MIYNVETRWQTRWRGEISPLGMLFDATKGNRVRNRCLFFLLPSLCSGFGVDCELIFRDWCLPLSRIIFEKSAFSVFRNFILYFYIFFFTILIIFRVKDSFFFTIYNVEVRRIENTRMISIYRLAIIPSTVSSLYFFFFFRKEFHLDDYAANVATSGSHPI